MADSLQQAPVAKASRNGDVEEYEVLIIGGGRYRPVLTVPFPGTGVLLQIL